MAKRANDLLDVFRLGSSEGDGPRAGKGGRSSRGGKGRSQARSKGFEGVFLAPRQVTLLASTAVLLVVLAFAAGLGYGRRGTAVPLQRTTAPAAWWIHGTLAQRDVLTGERVPADALARTVEKLLQIPSGSVRVLPDGSERYLVRLGPFQTEAHARAFVDRRNPETVRVKSWGSPFFRYTVNPGPRDPAR